MDKKELIDDAKRAVRRYIERELEANGETMVYPVVNIKLDHDPEGEWDNVNNAILVSRDGNNGDIHLYIMTCVMHKEVIQELFGIEIRDYVGHLVIDNDEANKKYLDLVKNFSLNSIRELKAEAKAKAEKKKMRFPGWDNL